MKIASRAHHHFFFLIGSIFITQPKGANAEDNFGLPNAIETTGYLINSDWHNDPDGAGTADTRTKVIPRNDTLMYEQTKHNRIHNWGWFDGTYDGHSGASTGTANGTGRFCFGDTLDDGATDREYQIVFTDNLWSVDGPDAANNNPPYADWLECGTTYTNDTPASKTATDKVLAKVSLAGQWVGAFSDCIFVHPNGNLYKGRLTNSDGALFYFYKFIPEDDVSNFGLPNAIETNGYWRNDDWHNDVTGGVGSNDTRSSSTPPTDSSAYSTQNKYDRIDTSGFMVGTYTGDSASNPGGTGTGKFCYPDTITGDTVQRNYVAVLVEDSWATEGPDGADNTNWATLTTTTYGSTYERPASMGTTDTVQGRVTLNGQWGTGTTPASPHQADCIYVHPSGDCYKGRFASGGTVIMYKLSSTPVDPQSNSLPNEIETHGYWVDSDYNGDTNGGAGSNLTRGETDPGTATLAFDSQNKYERIDTRGFLTGTYTGDTSSNNGGSTGKFCFPDTRSGGTQYNWSIILVEDSWATDGPDGNNKDYLVDYATMTTTTHGSIFELPASSTGPSATLQGGVTLNGDWKSGTGGIATTADCIFVHPSGNCYKGRFSYAKHNSYVTMFKLSSTPEDDDSNFGLANAIETNGYVSNEDWHNDLTPSAGSNDTRASNNPPNDSTTYALQDKFKRIDTSGFMVGTYEGDSDSETFNTGTGRFCFPNTVTGDSVQRDYTVIIVEDTWAVAGPDGTVPNSTYSSLTPRIYGNTYERPASRSSSNPIQGKVTLNGQWSTGNGSAAVSADCIWVHPDGTCYKGRFATAGLMFMYKLSSTPVDPLSKWLSETGLGTQVEMSSQMQDDPDKDGLPNLLEYSLGSDPLSANKFGVEIVREGNLIRITYVRRKASADSNLSYSLEKSSDLNVWSTVVATIEEDADQSDLPDGASAGTSQFERVAAVHDLGDVPPPRSFLRIRVANAAVPEPITLHSVETTGYFTEADWHNDSRGEGSADNRGSDIPEESSVYGFNQKASARIRTRGFVDGDYVGDSNSESQGSTGKFSFPDTIGGHGTYVYRVILTSLDWTTQGPYSTGPTGPSSPEHFVTYTDQEATNISSKEVGDTVEGTIILEGEWASNYRDCTYYHTDGFAYRVRLAKPGVCYAYRTVVLLAHGVTAADENGTSPKHAEFAGLKGISQLQAVQTSNNANTSGWEAGGMICVTTSTSGDGAQQANFTLPSGTANGYDGDGASTYATPVTGTLNSTKVFADDAVILYTNPYGATYRATFSNGGSFQPEKINMSDIDNPKGALTEVLLTHGVGNGDASGTCSAHPEFNGVVGYNNLQRIQQTTFTSIAGMECGGTLSMTPRSGTSVAQACILYIPAGTESHPGTGGPTYGTGVFGNLMSSKPFVPGTEAVYTNPNGARYRGTIVSASTIQLTKINEQYYEQYYKYTLEMPNRMKTYTGSDHVQAKIEGMNTYNFSEEGYLYFDKTRQVGNDDPYQVYLVDPASVDGWYVDFYDEDGTVSGSYSTPAQAAGQDLSLGANLMLNKAWFSTNDAPTYGFGPDGERKDTYRTHATGRGWSDAEWESRAGSRLMYVAPNGVFFRGIAPDKGTANQVVILFKL